MHWKADRNVSMGTKLTMTLDFEKPNINMHIPHFVLHSFLKVPMREFVQTSRQFICGDRFIHSHDLYVCSGSVTVWRNRMLVTIGALRVNIWLKHGSFNVYLSRHTYIHKRYLILNSKSSIFVDFFELTHYKTSKIK